MFRETKIKKNRHRHYHNMSKTSSGPCGPQPCTPKPVPKKVVVSCEPECERRKQSIIFPRRKKVAEDYKSLEKPVQQKNKLSKIDPKNTLQDISHLIDRVSDGLRKQMKNIREDKTDFTQVKIFTKPRRKGTGVSRCAISSDIQIKKKHRLHPSCCSSTKGRKPCCFRSGLRASCCTPKLEDVFCCDVHPDSGTRKFRRFRCSDEVTDVKETRKYRDRCLCHSSKYGMSTPLNRLLVKRESNEHLKTMKDTFTGKKFRTIKVPNTCGCAHVELGGKFDPSLPKCCLTFQRFFREGSLCPTHQANRVSKKSQLRAEFLVHKLVTTIRRDIARKQRLSICDLDQRCYRSSTKNMEPCGCPAHAPVPSSSKAALRIAAARKSVTFKFQPCECRKVAQRQKKRSTKVSKISVKDDDEEDDKEKSPPPCPKTPEEILKMLKPELALEQPDCGCSEGKNHAITMKQIRRSEFRKETSEMVDSMLEKLSAMPREKTKDTDENDEEAPKRVVTRGALQHQLAVLDSMPPCSLTYPKTTCPPCCTTMTKGKVGTRKTSTCEKPGCKFSESKDDDS